MTINNLKTLHCYLESPASYRKLWQEGSALYWPAPFVLPSWLESWWSHFADDYKYYCISVYNGRECIGVAPLMRKGSEAQLIGDKEVCDHLEFPANPEFSEMFFTTLLEYLKKNGVARLVLEPLRDDGVIYSSLLPIAKSCGYRVQTEDQDVLYAMDLPNSWKTYLDSLTGKERHEIRRKLRRLDEAGQVSLHCISQNSGIQAAMDTFFRLFSANIAQKADFMSGRMPSFFNQLANTLSADNILGLYLLEIDNIPVAATFCCDYQDTVYLYNNGYDSDYSHLSVGLLSKVLTIQKSIADGRRVYDFLKGEEKYKERLGGRPVAISRAVITLKEAEQ